MKDYTTKSAIVHTFWKQNCTQWKFIGKQITFLLCYNRMVRDCGHFYLIIPYRLLYADL